MDKITHEMRAAQWRSLLQECYSSGLNKRTWCQQNGVDEKQFYYWQRRLRQDAYNAKVASDTTLPAVSSPTAVAQKSIDFIEVKMTEQPPSTITSTFRPDVIIRNSSCVLEIANTASPELLNLIGGLLHAK